MAETFGGEFDPRPILHTVPDVALGNTGEVVTAMRTHPEALQRAGLGHLVPFSIVYLGVTDRAHKKLEWGLPPRDGGFARPDIVSEAIPHFGQQWFDHLRNYAIGDLHNIPDIWLNAFDNPAMLTANPAVQFAIPMGGHIDRDLPYTVEKVNAPADYHPDYTHHLGAILRDTAKAYAGDLLPVRALARHALTAGILRLIAVKREIAWKLGECLMDVRGDEVARAKLDQQIEHYSLLSGKAMQVAGNVALSQVVRFAPARQVLPQTSQQ